MIFLKKNRLTKADIRLYLPFFVVFGLSVIYHLRMHPMGGDDPFFAAALDGTTLTEYLAGRYEFWTSRIVLEAILVLVIKVPWLWRLINLLFYASLPVLFVRLLGGVPKEGGLCDRQDELLCWCSAGAVLLYPLHDMGTAGWITTTETHFWPLWGILFVALMLRRIACREKMSPLAAAFSIPVAVMTGSHEQYAVILLVLLILCGVYRLAHKNAKDTGYAANADEEQEDTLAGEPDTQKYLRRWIFGLYVAVSLVSLAVIAACPGNAARNAVSLSDLPVYETFGFGDKLYLGLLSIERVFIANADIVFVAVTLLVALLVYLKTDSYRKTLFSAAAFFILIGQTVIRTAFPGFASLFPVPGEVLSWDWGALTTWMPIVYLALSVVSLLYAFYQLLADQLLAYIYVVLLLGCGFGAGAVLGFMATIYVSGERVYAALYVILLLAALYAVQKLLTPLRDKCETAGGKLLLTFFALLCLANVLFEVLSIG